MVIVSVQCRTAFGLAYLQSADELVEIPYGLKKLHAVFVHRVDAVYLCVHRIVGAQRVHLVIQSPGDLAVEFTPEQPPGIRRLEAHPVYGYIFIAEIGYLYADAADEIIRTIVPLVFLAQGQVRRTIGIYKSRESNTLFRTSYFRQHIACNNEFCCR